MITDNEAKAARMAERDFSKWASLFTGNIFVKIAVYADESGTHDILNCAQPGSKAIVISGFIDTVDNWKKFSVDWKRVLERNRARYFHFRELGKKSRLEPGNPYHDWTEKRVDDFIYDLAMIAGRTAIAIGGQYHAALHLEIKGEPCSFKDVITQFFYSFYETMASHLSDYEGTVSFFFDQNDDPEWIKSVYEVFKTSQAAHPQLAELSFVSKEKHLPLQAADMSAYSIRQAAERFFKGKGQPVEPQRLRVLDLILQKNSLIDGHPLQFVQNCSASSWNRLIRLMRDDNKKQRERWKLEGKKDAIYYPLQHFPWDNFVR